MLINNDLLRIAQRNESLAYREEEMRRYFEDNWPAIMATGPAPDVSSNMSLYQPSAQYLIC
jgi:hypothetical protein